MGFFVVLSLMAQGATAVVELPQRMTSDCEQGRCSRLLFDYAPTAVDKRPGKRAAYSELDAAFRGVLVEKRDLFGVRSVRSELRLDRVSEEEVNGITRTSISYQQFVGDLRVDDGEVIASFANNLLIAVHGTLVSDADLSRVPALGKGVEKACDNTLTREHIYSRKYGRDLHLIECDGVKQLVDAEGTVVESASTRNEWVQSQGYVSSIVPPPAYGNFFEPVRILSQVQSCPEGTNPPCNMPRRNWYLPIDYENPNRRLTYGAGANGVSMAPFATVQTNGYFTPFAPSFTDPISYTNDPWSLAQVAYERITGAAQLVSWNSSAGLWAFRYPSDNRSLTAQVWTGPDSRCGTRALGSYGSGIMCLNFGYSAGFDWSYVPMHEYGHYMHGSYGLGGSSCNELATLEGLADATAISLEWMRVNATPSPGRHLMDPLIFVPG